jgi:ABC-type branched-subunit amino acid transport system substrate-binding protein
VRTTILLLVSSAVAVAVALSASIAGARSVNAEAATRTFVPASSSNLKLPLVKIGEIATIGSASSQAPALPAVVVATARAMNRSGGLHGHPLGVEFCNDQFDPNQTAACARKMVSDGVVAMVGGNSTFDGASQPILEAAGIPEICINPISTAATDGKNVYLASAGVGFIAYLALMGYAVHVAHDSPIAAYVNDNSVAKAFAGNVEDQLKQINGGQGWASLVAVPPATADFTPIGAAVARANPQGVFSLAGSTNGLNSMRAVNQLSSSIRHFYFPWSWSTDQLLTTAPDAMSKLIMAQPYPPLTDPRMARLARALKAEEARGDKLAGIQYQEGRTVDAWVGFQVLNTITKGMKSITAQTITNALNTAKNINIGPFIPPWTPSASGPSYYPRASNQSFWYVGYRNNQPYLLLNHPVSVPDALAGKF